MALDITSYLLGKKGSGGGASGLKVVVVETLPQTGETDILYLVPKTTTGTNNVFEEYLYVNDNWELIGTTDIDLSNYIQKSSTTGLIKNDGTIDTSTYLTQETPQVFSRYQTTSSNPLVLDGQKKGVYFIEDASGYLYYKAKSNSTTLSISSTSTDYIVFYEDINIDTMTKNKNIGFIKRRGSGQIQIGYLYLNSSNQLSITNTNTIGYTINFGAQTFNGVKTFADIPKIQNSQLATTDDQITCKKYVDNTVGPSVTTSSTSTYTISSLSGNKVYKLGEITSLTISAVTTFDRESVIYFESGSTATDITIPTSLNNIGDVPTLTTSGSTNTGTCATNKKYIISVLNNIAVWKEY